MRVRGFAHENICAMNRDPFDTQAIEHEREVAEAKRKQRLERFSVQLKEAMASKEGREMIFTILDFCQLQVCSFNTNALAMSFSEGRRSVGLTLQSFIDPELFLQMLREQHGRRKQH